MKAITTLLIWLVLSPLLESASFEVTARYPKDFFRAPVSHNMLISGTFGELRPNHFHAGIDIKSSRGVAGDPILSAANGFVSRIKVEESGYGNSVFIEHPNGYTTLYAHLHQFNEAIAAIVRRYQFERKSYVVDIKLGADELEVNAGHQIGTMGNSGASNGVHLHFEVRKTGSNDAVNPLLFGFPVIDNVPPKMHALRVYSLNENRESLGAFNYPLLHSKQTYKVKGDTISMGSDRVGLALKVYDHFDKVSNWNGVYRVSLYEDDKFTYSFEFESFSFNETRYINAHCDYVERVSRNSYFNRIYSLPGNMLSIYQRQKNDGVVSLSETPKKINMVAADLAGNTSTLEFWIKKNPSVDIQVKEKKYNYFLPFDEGNMIQTDQIMVSLPKGTLYENLYMQYFSTPERSNNHYSSVHQLHNSKTPVHDYFNLAIKPNKPIPLEKQSKVFIAYCEGKSVLNCGGIWKDGFLEASVRNFGDYCIMTDETAPTIVALNFQNDLRKGGKISFRIYDNYQVAGNVKGLSYEAFIDGKWVLMEFDRKYARITHQFDKTLAPGEHQFKLVVRDAVGNEAIYENTFIK